MTVRLHVLQPAGHPSSRHHASPRGAQLSLVLPSPETPYWRPQTRADCADVPRPCPYVACVHHLYAEVDGHDTLRVNFPHLEPDEMPASCAADLAAEGGMTLDAVAKAMGGLSRERIRQIEKEALAKLLLAAKRARLERP